MIFIHQFVIMREHLQGGIQFVQDLRPGFEFDPAFGFTVGDEARDESGDDPCSPLEEVSSHQGIDEGTLARFDRSHHGNAQQRVFQ